MKFKTTLQHSNDYICTILFRLFILFYQKINDIYDGTTPIYIVYHMINNKQLIPINKQARENTHRFTIWFDL